MNIKTMNTKTQPCISERPASWYDHVTINGARDAYETLPPAGAHTDGPAHTRMPEDFDAGRLPAYINNDRSALPVTSDREGYHGDRHYDWWLSGLRDFHQVRAKAGRHGVELGRGGRVFELGCASGRVLRHFNAHVPGLECWGCDISLRHAEWVRLFLPPGIRVFQNSTYPSLPLESNYFDAVCAFSVFTHIDELEIAWLLELRRILRPGGVAYLTVHTENTWHNMGPDWPIFNALQKGRGSLIGQQFNEDMTKGPLPLPKTVFRWRETNIYNTNVFHHSDYLRNAWARHFSGFELYPRLHDTQDVCVLVK
jgi:SAM-dependent methyltransferase